MTITAGFATPIRAAVAAMESSRSIVMRWSGHQPRSMIATGVSAGSPRPSSVAVLRASRATPISSTRVWSARAGSSESSSCPVAIEKPVATPRWVTGIPAAAGTEMALVTPGTTLTSTPWSRQ